MKLVFEDVECLTEIALPAIDVGHHQDVVGSSLSRRDRFAHRPMKVDGRAGAGDAEPMPVLTRPRRAMAAAIRRRWVSGP